MGCTPAQLDAVRARGNVIVVAGAGTGKTTALVERAAALLEEGLSVGRLLLVTFTDAAAAEMRHRLRLRLTALATASAGEAAARWHEQLALLDTARIGTLHSFCLQLVRDHFHLLGMDPAAGILDEQQTRPLIEAALDECLAPHFAGEIALSAGVREAIRRYAGGDSERLRPLILKLHRHAQSLPSPEAWYAGQIAAWESPEPRQWRDWLAAALREWAEKWLPEVERDAGLASNLARSAAALRRIKGGTSGSQAADALAEILAADGAEWPWRMKTRLRGPVEAFFSEARFLASQFAPVEPGDTLAADWNDVRGSLSAMLALARDFGARFAAAKREQGGMDFSDLEQFALRLLWNERGQPSAVAAACREQFDQVFVDECQDINAAQDAVLRAVSRPGAGGGDGGGEPAEGNRFLVGDVKQSIYQFRLARPELFRDYEKAWGKGGGGTRVSLTDNFRSHPGIVAFVNSFFGPLMREAAGGAGYEPLNAGRADGSAGPCPAEGGPNPMEAGQCQALQLPGRRVEFHLIPRRDAAQGGDDDEWGGDLDAAPDDSDDLPVVEREARMVAARLRELKASGLTVWDKEARHARLVEWGDMAVLLRSPAGRVEAFAKEFHRCGVPLQAGRGGFLASTEASDLLSLVRALDNPLQDIPLLAVLRSPLVAMSLDELALARIASGARRLWVALREFALKRDPAGAPPDGPAACPAVETARRKADWFLQHYAKWRELARQASLSHCLETALADAHYEAVIRAGERGAARAANVRKFLSLVRRYDPCQRQGVFRFLRFVESLQDAEQDIEPAPSAARDAVRLMSLHRSKGLEFPVVAVACLGAQFNEGDLRSDALVDDEFGLCAKAVSSAGARHPTLAHWLAARRQRRRLLGEELRLLYVAMTRARDRLILTGTARRRNAEQWEADPGREFPERAIMRARSPLDWVCLWLPRETRVEDSGRDEGENELFRWRVCREEPALPATRDERAGLAPGAPGAADPAAVLRRVEWRYASAPATEEPAKTTVTALRRRAAEEDEDARELRFAHKPSTPPDALDAPAVGALHHEFLRGMPLAGADDEESLRKHLAERVAAGGFSADEAAALDLAAVADFWRSEAGSLIRSHAASVRREAPFTARFSPPELARITGAGAAPGLAEEFVVVQGVADLMVLLPGEIWLLDFKTDAVRGRELEQRAAEYRPQLALYAAALAAIHRRPVTRRWLRFLRARKTVGL